MATKTTLMTILHLLADGNYHAGNQIGDHLKITRSAVWKNIKKLERYGIQINSMKGRGYALQSPLIPLSAPMIRNQLQHKIPLTLLETVDSTNLFLKNRKKSFVPRNRIK